MIRDGIALFSGSPARTSATLADLKLGRLLDTFDAWAIDAGLDDEVGPPHRPSRPGSTTRRRCRSTFAAARSPRSSGRPATGRTTRSSHAPVLDRKGRLRHDGGVVTDAPGLYAIGLNLLRRRKSSFIHGAEDDARELTDHLAAHLGVAAPV